MFSPIITYSHLFSPILTCSHLFSPILTYSHLSPHCSAWAVASFNFNESVTANISLQLLRVFHETYLLVLLSWHYLNIE